MIWIRISLNPILQATRQQQILPLKQRQIQPRKQALIRQVQLKQAQAKQKQIQQQLTRRHWQKHPQASLTMWKRMENSLK